MCFMTKCPYVPPHPFNLDFPHLMLRHRAAEAKNGKNEFHPGPAGRDGPQRHAWRASPRRSINWASDKCNKPMRAADGKGGRHRPQRHLAEIPQPHLRLRRPRAIRSRPTSARPPSASARPRSMPPASSITTSRRPAWRRARCSIISASKPRSPIPAAAACRSWNRPTWTRVAAERREGVEGIGQADRRGLRHRRADRLLRADAEIRMAADRARTMRTCKRVAEATLRHRRICRGRRQEGGPARRPDSPCPKASPCIWPVMPAPRIWGRRRPRC